MTDHCGFGPVSISIGAVSGVKGVCSVIVVTLRRRAANASLQALAQMGCGGRCARGLMVPTGRG